MHEKRMIFKTRKDEALARESVLHSKHRAVSWYRVLVFAVSVVLFVYLLDQKQFVAAAGVAILFVIAFGILVNIHNRIKRKRSFEQRLAAINEEEIKRLKHDFDGLDEGMDFMDESHPYAWDLDIFGSNSLFQLINRTGSYRGRQKLAEWMLNTPNAEVIPPRQDAVKELTPMIDWRQRLQAEGQTGYKQTDVQKKRFYQWLDGKDVIAASKFYKILPWLMIAISCMTVTAMLAGILSFYFIFIPLVLSGYFLMKTAGYSRDTYEMTLSGIRTLSAIENSLKLIEGRNFETIRLRDLREKLLNRERAASKNIMALRKIFEWLSMRHNQIYMLFNGFMLLDYFWLYRAEKWRSNYKMAVSSWFDALAEFEALSSMAAFAFAHRQYAWPEIMENPYNFIGKNAGHPLIPDDKRVCNDFSLRGRGAVCIITGSNMAGKSTFLRTVGINAVLAFMGAPVCASELKLSVFRVFTSMRTKDNLEENISSFYAELLRLKMLLSEVEKGMPVLYLLDEILKGTNSYDRHTGAQALIRQLSTSTAFGLVSTHDLELGRMAENNDLITNFHFDSRIDEEEIIFDYKLRPGICHNTNASRLMEKIGIRLDVS